MGHLSNGTFVQWVICPMGRLSNNIEIWTFVQWDIYPRGHLSNNDNFFNNPFVQYYINFDICCNCQLYQENILGLSFTPGRTFNSTSHCYPGRNVPECTLRTFQYSWRISKIPWLSKVFNFICNMRLVITMNTHNVNCIYKQPHET